MAGKVGRLHTAKANKGVCRRYKKGDCMNYLKRGFSFILFLSPFLSYGQFVSVCDRTPQVRDAIMEKVRQIDFKIECQDNELLRVIISEIKILNLDEKNITFLKPGDFAGLSSLGRLYLGDNRLTSLPPGIFNGLSSLYLLYIDNNFLTSLPPGIFDGLSRLKRLYLGDNRLTSLPLYIFYDLESLEKLELDDNNFTELDHLLFYWRYLENLETLDLRKNPLSDDTKDYLSREIGEDFKLLLK